MHRNPPRTAGPRTAAPTSSTRAHRRRRVLTNGPTLASFAAPRGAGPLRRPGGAWTRPCALPSSPCSGPARRRLDLSTTTRPAQIADIKAKFDARFDQQARAQPRPGRADQKQAEEIARLHGQIETLSYELKPKKRQQDFYLDLDSRLRKLRTPGRRRSGASPKPAGDPVAEGQNTKQRSISSRPTNSRRPPPLGAFLQKRPDSSLAPNAQFWLATPGTPSATVKKAIEAQSAVTSKWPDGSKALTPGSPSPPASRKWQRRRQQAQPGNPGGQVSRRPGRQKPPASASRRSEFPGAGRPVAPFLPCSSQRNLLFPSGVRPPRRPAHRLRPPHRLPLRCVWCDTAYAFTGGTAMSIEAVLAEVARHPPARSASPAASPGPEGPVWRCSPPSATPATRFPLETSGALDIAEVDRRVARIVDLKAPASGESARKPLGKPGPAGCAPPTK